MKRSFYLLLIVSLFACNSDKKAITDEYIQDTESWRAKRLNAIIGDEGWATLISLEFLDEGENRMGSDSSNEILLPEGVPSYLGSFFVQGEQVIFNAASDSIITVEDSLITSMVITQETHPVFRWETFNWFVIYRGGRPALRIRNTLSPTVVNFKGLEYFPLDPEWIVKARFELHDPPRIKTIETVLNTTVEYPNPATLFFEYKSDEYSLEALDEGGDEYFLIFTDLTSAKETYGAGRYMYISKTPVDGLLTIDFNRCYNPPCAFTPYATCPIPPPENQLNVAIRAGELNYH